MELRRVVRVPYVSSFGQVWDNVLLFVAIFGASNISGAEGEARNATRLAFSSANATWTDLVAEALRGCPAVAKLDDLAASADALPRDSATIGGAASLAPPLAEGLQAGALYVTCACVPAFRGRDAATATTTTATATKHHAALAKPKCVGASGPERQWLEKMFPELRVLDDTRQKRVRDPSERIVDTLNAIHTVCRHEVCLLKRLQGSGDQTTSSSKLKCRKIDCDCSTYPLSCHYWQRENHRKSMALAEYKWALTGSGDVECGDNEKTIFNPLMDEALSPGQTQSLIEPGLHEFRIYCRLHMKPHQFLFASMPGAERSFVRLVDSDSDSTAAEPVQVYPLCGDHPHPEVTLSRGLPALPTSCSYVALVVKPCGLPAEPHVSNVEHSVQNQVKRLLPLSWQEGCWKFTVHPAHRLDSWVGGLMAVYLNGETRGASIDDASPGRDAAGNDVSVSQQTRQRRRQRVCNPASRLRLSLRNKIYKALCVVEVPHGIDKKAEDDTHASNESPSGTVSICQSRENIDATVCQWRQRREKFVWQLLRRACQAELSTQGGKAGREAQSFSKKPEGNGAEDAEASITVEGFMPPSNLFDRPFPLPFSLRYLEGWKHCCLCIEEVEILGTLPKIAAEWEDKAVNQKSELAEVEGISDDDESKRAIINNNNIAAAWLHDSAKEALTIFSEAAVRGTEAIAVELTVKLATGRRHQIRSTLACMGCQIFGDTQYGPLARDDLALRRLSEQSLATCAAQHKLERDASQVKRAERLVELVCERLRQGEAEGQAVVDCTDLKVPPRSEEFMIPPRGDSTEFLSRIDECRMLPRPIGLWAASVELYLESQPQAAKPQTPIAGFAPISNDERIVRPRPIRLRPQQSLIPWWKPGGHFN